LDIDPLTKQQLNQLRHVSETILGELSPTNERPAGPDGNEGALVSAPAR
jgi:hypothetical protein